jgi:multidrug efflux pump subunit AcrA (membrane-fusion protein)
MKSMGTRFAIALLSAALLAGCGVIAHGPVTAPITIDQRGPVSVGSATSSARVGRAEAYGILIFSTGDASISAAMKAGRITRVHHVDNETMNIMGVYAKYTTIVYGE